MLAMLLTASRIRRLGLPLALLAFSLSCNETRQSSYATRREATRQGAAAHGWLPDAVPPDATNIREIHDLDSNATWLVFELEESARQRFLEHLGQTVPRADGNLTITRPSGVDWWPAELVGRVADSTRRNPPCSAWQIERHGVLILCEKERRVFFWRQSAP